MRHEQIFTKNKKIAELYGRFQKSQGPLFHYTQKCAIDSIKQTSELWITRSDSFFDKSEIIYGLSVFKEAEDCVQLNGKKQEIIRQVFLNLEESLKNSYILSLSQDAENKYLIRQYGEWAIEFYENFPNWLGGAAFHSKANGDGFRHYHFLDHYEKIEGKVIYDRSVQLEIAKAALKAIAEMVETGGHIVDHYHAIEIISSGIILFKKENFSVENEYRVALIKKSNEVFDQIRLVGEKEKFYIRARIPTLLNKCIGSISNGAT